MTALLHDDLVRVFELPAEGPEGYRFGGGVPVDFLEVDWFAALPPASVPNAGVFPGPYPDPRTMPDEWERQLREYLAQKVYIKPGRRYLALCLHRSFVFEGEQSSCA